MKKLITLFLVAFMTISMVVCGEETTLAETTTAEKVGNRIFEIGEVATTDVVEFSVIRFEYAKMLKNATFETGKAPDPEYLLPTEENQKNNPFAAEDGQIMISFSYSLKNTGKKELTFPINLDIYADYNDGYEFEGDVKLLKGDFVISKDTTSLTPLSDACEGRGYIKVPLEVMENEEAPLFLSINLPTDNNSENMTNVIYNIRHYDGEKQEAGDELVLSSDTLVGTWYFVQGDLYKTDKTTLSFEIYKGGTAEEIYEDNSLNRFKWVISESDPDVVNFEMESIFGSLGGTRGFTLEVIDGLIQLQSVDGKIILTKDNSQK